jgi:hypothetical protein
MSDRETFLKLCASLSDKELCGAAAARLIWMLKQHNTNWDKVLSPFAFHKAAEVSSPDNGNTPMKLTAQTLLALGDLTEWERDFVTSVSTRSNLTEKQQPIWERICEVNARVLHRTSEAPF